MIEQQADDSLRVCTRTIKLSSSRRSSERAGRQAGRAGAQVNSGDRNQCDLRCGHGASRDETQTECREREKTTPFQGCSQRSCSLALCVCRFGRVGPLPSAPPLLRDNTCSGQGRSSFCFLTVEFKLLLGRWCCFQEFICTTMNSSDDVHRLTENIYRVSRVDLFGLYVYMYTGLYIVVKVCTLYTGCC